MSDKRYYIRLRGKVLGPFHTEQLRSLRDRGQLGRFHEVSEDRRSWLPATSVAEVFPAALRPEPVAALANVQEATVVPTPEVIEWYYLDPTANRHGPVPTAQLQALQQTGTIAADSLVWRAGLTEWVPYSSTGLETRPPGATWVADAARGPVVNQAADSAEAALGWRRVRTGLTLTIIAAFLQIGAGGFLLLMLIVLGMAEHSSDVAAARLLFIFFAVVAFAAQVVEAVGYGFCVGIPPASGVRGVAIGALVLAIIHPFLSLFYGLDMVLAGSMTPWQAVSEGQAVVALSYCLLALLWLVSLTKPFLFQIDLRLIARYQGANPLAQQFVYLLILFGVGVFLWLVFILVASLSPAFVEWCDRPALAGQALVRALLGLGVFFVWLGWFVWYLVLLFRSRAVVHSQLTRA